MPYTFPTALATNRIIRASALDQLPDPNVSDEIIIPTNFTLIIESDIDLGVNTIVPTPPSTVVGVSNRSASLTSSNEAGPLSLNSVTTGFYDVSNLVLSNSVASANALTLAAGNGLLLQNCIFANNSICRLEVFSSIAIVNNGFPDAQLIIAEDSTNGGILIEANRFTQSSAMISMTIEATAIIGNLELTNNDFETIIGGIGIDEKVGASVLQGSINCGSFSGAGLFTRNFDHTSDQWLFNNAVGLTSSFNQNNIEAIAAGTTLAATANVWTSLSDAGVTITYAENGTPQKWSLTDANTSLSTYNGVRSITAPVSAFLSFEGNGADTVDFGLSINGANPVAGNFVTVTTAMAQRGTLTTPAYPIALITSRTVELMFRLNNTSSIDFFQAQLIPSQ